ncbi:Splicing factor 3B subunit 1 [Bifiguratus adelaidae]|uniref:Splicing factor 3B subunit 1 n=1 Tax=Bifiguratus adelaidae TaxID=1938954 RepID=A0A261Y2D6_9FUNG|nr:Splicing factor 3B subunit 1 [Bifiguratus adelaidae]
MADDFENQIKAAQAQRSKLGQANGNGLPLNKPLAETRASMSNGVSYDTDHYGKEDKYEGYVTSLPMNDEEEEEMEVDGYGQKNRMLNSYTAPKDVFKEISGEDDHHDPFAETAKNRRIADREDEYHARRFNRRLSPERVDAFGKADGASGERRTYGEVMKEAELDREQQRIMHQISEKKKEQEKQDGQAAEGGAAKPARKRRWDMETPVIATNGSGGSSWNDDDASSIPKSRWDETPRADDVSATPRKRNRWDETPVATSNKWDATPTATGKKSRWDETPVNLGMTTPVGGMGMMTPTPSGLMTPEAHSALRWERELDVRNRPLSDEELDAMFPSTGYKILEPPAGYAPIMTPARKLMATPTPIGDVGGFMMQDEMRAHATDMPGEIPGGVDLPNLKQEDIQHFGKLLEAKDEDSLSLEELMELKIMRLLLRIKNGTPPMRKSALRQITEKAREFGPGPLFNQILPLLMSPSLEDQERHLLVKVVDRILYKLDDLVRPYVHKILVVIEPLLIDEDYYARVEGREIISNLSKAAGLPTMITTMRPDIDHIDEYVRNTTARAFSVVASALGIPALLPFLKAVCKSKKSWQARHTGIKIVQQIAILLGCAVLPHLKNLVDAIAHGLEDEQQKVRTITALAIAALAEAAAPYGIESFDSVLKPLWTGIRKHRGKGLAAFLKAIGYIIPLMDDEYANYYTKEVMVILIREFQSPDEEMKKIVLKVVKQCAATDGVTPAYIKEEILPEFFKHFWVRRMALDRRNYKQVVETTVELANKVGVTEIVGRIVEDLKDESEPYRKMVMETIDNVISTLGAADIDQRLEEVLIDGILYAFQEQVVEDVVMLNGFGVVVNALGMRTKPYLQQICYTVLWRLNNKSAKVRQQAADLISRIATVMKTCGEEILMGQLGQILYEYLGEEYPEVLGSILGALKSIVNVIGMASMTPPIKDLLPRLTPILKNRHEKVQENCIDLVGRIADRGAEYVSAREWMRICFELLDLLRAHKMGIRRAAVNTFGYIAKAIGPQDVLATLLNNLKVQERQIRVCTTVAIAIVAETCAPFTVLPAIMNEYRVPELNVQNGVLKSLSFMFEYIGEMGKDYIYAVTPLLEDALMDRDLVHRQTACTTIKHMALGVLGLNCEDALLHLLNYVWPNIFETSPHVINAVTDAIEGLRVALGPSVILQYVLQGLFHPARKVREIYWKIYNSLYIGSQDALVPLYPRIEDDERNHYQRYELDYFFPSLKRKGSASMDNLPVADEKQDLSASSAGSLSPSQGLGRSNAKFGKSNRNKTGLKLSPIHLSPIVTPSSASSPNNSPSSLSTQFTPTTNAYKTKDEFADIFGKSSIPTHSSHHSHADAQSLKMCPDTSPGVSASPATLSSKSSATPLSEPKLVVTSEDNQVTQPQETSVDEEETYMQLKPEDFEVEKRLGEGAAGTVRRVRHNPSGIIMAKKSITADPDPAVQRQILRELAFLRTCDSPHIVSFYGAFLDEADTTIAICMEYCEAGSLEDIYKRCKQLQGVIGEGVLAKIAESVCKGLVYLHSKKVIHRDIKPSNILMTRKGEIKLCDFGVSGELENSLAQTFTGTKYYMAPERIQGAKYDVSSDIWSLGLTIIEVAERRPALPPPGIPALAIFELLDFIVHQPVPELGEDRSPECRNFVAVCLTKDPKLRPSPQRMLTHPFIQKWQNTPVNLESWVMRHIVVASPGDLNVY